MDIRLLGPVELSHQGRAIPLGGARLPALLSILALRANRTVTVAQLARAIWPEPPRAAGSNVRSYVAQLRNAFEAAGEAGTRITTDGNGYRLVVHPDELDLARFEELAASGERALAGAEPARALDPLREAVGLWRGEPLGGAPVGPLLQAEIARLDERRLRVTELWAEAALAAGRGQEVVTELSGLVRTDPLRESLWELLMRALHRGGRQAAALDAYQEAYRLFSTELGIQPGRRLQQLHHQILTADAALDAPARPVAEHPVPRQLPADIAGFAGRVAELDQLDSYVDGGAPVAVVGMAGVGKTALAVCWAHRVAGRFPDGQLHADLRGHSPGPPVGPGQILGEFLRALGVPPESVPAATDEAAALYRSLLAGRRVLVLLDNAATPDQVRPLLPGDPGCLALITSRDWLGGLTARDGAYRLGLDVLSPGESLDVLAGMVGAARVSTEPAAGAELARLCAGLPLALRIAGANVAALPGATLTGYAAELAGGDRLAALHVDGDPRTAVRAMFDLSYDRLAPVPRRLFRLLGLLDAAEADADVAARLLAVAGTRAAEALGTLARAHLVELHASGRYRMHDLLKLFARELSLRGDPIEARARAIVRVARWQLGRVRRAHDAVFPVPRASRTAAGATAARDWFAAERANLFALAQQAAAGPDRSAPEGRRLAVELMFAMALLVRSTGYTAEWDDVLAAGLVAVRADRDHAGIARTLTSRAAARAGRGDIDAALRDYTAAIAAYRDAGDATGELTARMNQGVARHVRGELRGAVRFYRAGLLLARTAGDRRVEAYILANLGAAYRDMGRYPAAIESAAAARAIFQEIGDWPGEVDALDDLGQSHRANGDPAAAAGTHRAALTVNAGRDIGREGHSLWQLGEDLRAQGHLDDAVSVLRRATDLLDRAGASESATARRALAAAAAGAAAVDAPSA